MVIEWEEIFLSSETISEISVERLDKTLNVREFDGLKKNLLDSIYSSDLFIKPLDAFLKTDLSGKIIPYFPKTNPIDEKTPTINTIVDEFLFFYKNNFKKDDEALISILKILVSQEKWSEIRDLIQSYKRNSSLPLSIEIYLIITDIIPGALSNAILHGEETDPLNIIYKFKFFEISESEKNLLYDKVLEEKNENLIGFVFHLFKDNIDGLRSLNPILEILHDNFNFLDKKDHRIFIEAYIKTGKLFKTFFLVKKIYHQIELREWIQLQRKIYGKSRDKDAIKPKVEINKKDLFLRYKDLSFLSPFEMYNLLEDPTSHSSFQEYVMDSFRRFPYSYKLNQALGILYFYKKDYLQSLKYIENSGSFKWNSESLYIKAICLFKCGFKRESNTIFKTLKETFPLNEEIKKYL